MELDRLEYIDMPLNDGDRAWIRQEIHTIHSRHGLGKLTGFIKDWGGTGAAVAILAIFFTQWGTYVEFRTHTQDRLDSIEKQLAPLVIQNYAKLPPGQLVSLLPEVKSAVASLRQKNIKAPPEDINEISRKLATADTQNPEFWQTAAVIINYRSSSLVGDIKNWTATFPPCRFSGNLDASPGAYAQPLTPDGKPAGPRELIDRVGSQDCNVDLDGKTLSRWDCTRCLVKYSGGPLKMREVHFIDCLFIFDFTEKRVPTPDGQRFSESLLASELSDVSVPES